jgi:hypothetical protein
MIYFLLFEFSNLVVLLALFSQIKLGEDDKSFSFSSPKEFTIADIEFRTEGGSLLDNTILKMLTGLNEGDKIQIPGEQISKAIPPFRSIRHSSLYPTKKRGLSDEGYLSPAESICMGNKSAAASGCVRCICIKESCLYLKMRIVLSNYLTNNFASVLLAAAILFSFA